MASRNPETDTTPFSSPTINLSTVLEEFDKTEKEINSHFNWLHQILKDKNKAILDKLSEKRAEFVELEADRVGQIEEIETMKQQTLNIGVKFNKTNILREETVNIYEDAIKKLQIPIQSQKIIFDNFSDTLKTIISLIDLKFVEDYMTKINPILSIDSNSILKTIDAFENEKLLVPKLKDLVIAEEPNDDEEKELKKVDLFRLAFDSETNCLFVLSNVSHYILVFQQDGTLIACFGEEFKNLDDLCIDNNNKFLYVLDESNCIYKFNLTTYQLLKKKENEDEDIKNKMRCLDIHNEEIYVGTEVVEENVYVFNSELEPIRCISTLTFGCLDIICRDEDILIFSFLPSGLNIYSYNGDLIRNIPHFFELRMNHIEMLEDIQFNPFQLSLDKNGLILFSNPIDNCINILTSGGHLVHKIDILPQEEKNTFISGVASTNDGRIFVSVSNSKYPLRCY